MSLEFIFIFSSFFEKSKEVTEQTKSDHSIETQEAAKLVLFYTRWSFVLLNDN